MSETQRVSVSVLQYQYADAANTKMEPEDASPAFARGTLESHQGENRTVALSPPENKETRIA